MFGMSLVERFVFYFQIIITFIVPFVDCILLACIVCYLSKIYRIIKQERSE